MREFDKILIEAIDKFNKENLANDEMGTYERQISLYAIEDFLIHYRLIDENSYQIAIKHISKLIDKL